MAPGGFFFLWMVEEIGEVKGGDSDDRLTKAGGMIEGVERKGIASVF